MDVFSLAKASTHYILSVDAPLKPQFPEKLSRGVNTITQEVSVIKLLEAKGALRAE